MLPKVRAVVGQDAVKVEPAGVPVAVIDVAVQRVVVPAENVTVPAVSGPTGKKLEPVGGERVAVSVTCVFRGDEFAGMALVIATVGFSASTTCVIVFAEFCSA